MYYRFAHGHIPLKLLNECHENKTVFLEDSSSLHLNILRKQQSFKGDDQSHAQVGLVSRQQYHYVIVRYPGKNVIYTQGLNHI